jgi:hypothetical protein
MKPTLLALSLLLGLASFLAHFAYSAAAPPPSDAPAKAITHGQQINAQNTGRAGAAAVKGYSPTLKTIDGDQTYSTTQTIDNVHFTGNVLVTGGDVTFNFCSFTFQPPSASHSSKAQQLGQYNNGGPAGHLVCNWCDFDTGLPLTGGDFETCNFQPGQRVGKPTTGDSSFTLFRCRLQHCGNAIGMHQYHTDKMSFVTECYFGDPTNGDRSHPDGFEIYSSDNLTVQRCRIILTNRDQSCLNITNDFRDVPVGNPILINDNYISGGSSPVLALTQGGTVKKNVRFEGNYFSDSSQWGRECDFDHMDVTYDLEYAKAHPEVIYWAKTNVWAPDGEGVSNPAKAPSGDVPAGIPHVKGAFVGPDNFYGGATWRWNGHVLP